MEEETEQNFICRVCGHDKFEATWESNGIMGPGGRAWPVYIFCRNCFAMFKKVENRFTEEPKNH